ncbi:hypothetical protein MXD63_17810 [Frankia sp. Cpl3]|uniref:hypothetical protein n=1 Tax=Parafrankia colletiae TaxID=573497 RepID=UPI001F51754B|nr:hypothetical protein [Parafrankia colletiae]MCK9901921.1 hypothetical protein [Frankia sp. Cpl3]
MNADGSPHSSIVLINGSGDVHYFVGTGGATGERNISRDRRNNLRGTVSGATKPGLLTDRSDRGD